MPSYKEVREHFLLHAKSADLVCVLVNGEIESDRFHNSQPEAISCDVKRDKSGIHVHLNLAADTKLKKVLIFNGLQYGEPSSAVDVARIDLVYHIQSNAHVEVLECHAIDGEMTKSSAYSVQTQLTIGVGARVAYALLTNMQSGIAQFNLRASVEANAHLQFFNLNRDAKSLLCQQDISLVDVGAEVDYYGLTNVGANSRIQSKSLIHHQMPKTRSQQIVRHIVNGSAKAEFIGRLKIDVDAQQSDAHQQNSNLLLSDQAEVKSHPQLEVFADDVKATHGATVGQLDEQEIFYLQSRAIPLPKAKEMISFGFQKQLVDKVTSTFVRQGLLGQLADGVTI